MDDLEKLRYPIGKHSRKPEHTAEEVGGYLQEIRTLPARLIEAVKGLSEAQLETPYRPEGWTVRQVVHHLADSHMTAYSRIHLALTEDKPPVKPFDQTRWAELPDGKHSPINFSLDILTALHMRWLYLIEHLSPEQHHKTYVHSANGETTVDMALALYAWHGAHHLAQITGLKARQGW